MSKKLWIMALSSMPMLVMAHPGHEHSHSGFLSGFLHPFSGLDHLMMALAFGVLIWTGYQRWKVLGCIGLIIAMIAGFMLGTQHILSASMVEYGIVFSLVLLAVALWSRTLQFVSIVAVLLASFHGMAHGTELGHHGHAFSLMFGMVSAMSLIYIVGLALGALIERYIPYGKKIIALCAATVALIGIA